MFTLRKLGNRDLTEKKIKLIYFANVCTPVPAHRKKWLSHDAIFDF
jgi:hypothetical protein